MSDDDVFLEEDLDEDEKKAKRTARKKAEELLRSPLFFNRFLEDIRRAGLVGERRNALALYIVATSRLRERPVNAIVKGQSSSGKNFLVRKVTEFFPAKCIHEVSSMSAHALNFVSEEDLEHSVLYFYEIDSARARSAHPNRLLISEGKLVHWYSASSSGGRETRQKVTGGPVACISTTTENALTIDDESRHLSLWIDESPTQTKRIAAAYLGAKAELLTPEAKLVWREVQYLLGERKDVSVGTPDWFERLVDLMPTGDVRIRRYWPAFVEACKTVTLIRSYGRNEAEREKQATLTVNFNDFAIANLVLDKTVAESLTRSAADEEVWTGEMVARIAEQQGGKGVEVTNLLGEPGVTSLDKAYRLLRRAEHARTIFRANPSEKNNAKLYLPAAELGFLGSPESVLGRLGLKFHGQFFHPVTGKLVTYGRKPK
jgi:hypothetical protein